MFRSIARLGILPHLGDEAIALARDGANEALPLAAVADGVTDRSYAAAQRRFSNDAPVPYRRGKIIVADDTMAVAYQIGQDIEHLRLGSDGLGSPTQVPATDVERITLKKVDQSTPRPRTSRACVGRMNIGWGTDDDTFTMSWTEREGPPVRMYK